LTVKLSEFTKLEGKLPQKKKKKKKKKKKNLKAADLFWLYMYLWVVMLLVFHKMSYL
jgi:cell division septal protein FtsQ